MTRKLMVLTAAATIALVANGLNAQQVDDDVKNFDDRVEYFKQGPEFKRIRVLGQQCQQCSAMKATGQAAIQKQMDAFHAKPTNTIEFATPVGSFKFKYGKATGQAAIQKQTEAIHGKPPTNAKKLGEAYSTAAGIISLNGAPVSAVQECQECPAMSNSSRPVTATLTDGMMLIDGHMIRLSKASSCSECPANCKQCDSTKTDCETCPHCCAQAANASHNSSVPTKLAAELTGSSGLPGSTAFIREQCQELTANRKRLAKQIADYLANDDHSPQHIQRVLELAMESSADQAHRQAMPPTPFISNLSVYAADDSNLKTLPATPPQPSANGTTSFRERELMKKLKKLNSEQQSTRNIVTLLQKDLQRVAEDVSLLRVESNMTTRSQQNHSASRSQTWPSRIEAAQPSGMVRIQNQFTNAAPPMVPNKTESVAELKNQIHQLERQLSMMAQRQMHGVQQATLETPANQLLPRHQGGMPLTPVAPLRTNTVTYYVGDIMAPPFVSANLKLMQFLKTNVDPDSWDRHGKIEISEPSISLSITQTPENHTRIQNILESIRAGRVSYKRMSTNQLRREMPTTMSMQTSTNKTPALLYHYERGTR